jgi:hypothetical protein
MPVRITVGNELRNVKKPFEGNDAIRSVGGVFIEQRRNPIHALQNL